MNFLLDTNLMSESRKRVPNEGVSQWHANQDPAHLFISTITLAEAWQGFHSLEPDQ